MSNWTQLAKAEWEDYCAKMRASLAGTEADPAEVIDDLKRHLDAEIARAGLQVVTVEDVQRLIRQFGGPTPESSQPSSPAPSVPPIIQNKPKPPHALLFLGGVVLPLIAWLIEVLTRFCAANIFDPLPTWWHAMLVGLVPVGNLLAQRELMRPAGVRHHWLIWLNGMGIGVALYYAFAFLPLTPLGLLGVVFYGVGLLPLTPLLSLFATFAYRGKMLRQLAAPQSGWAPPLLAGMALGVLALIVPEIPRFATRAACEMARSEEPATRLKGIQMLRRWGDRDLLLRFCYQMPARATDLTTFMATQLFSSQEYALSAGEAQTMFFRVYGQPFNSEPPPRTQTRAAIWRELDDNFTWDPDSALGGESVAGRVKGLTLVASRLDGLVESRGSAAYMEWTLEFENKYSQAREARAQILLPPGGVVSRLTLWVNGEEREAAFAGRGQTREAYQKIAVERRRDPVLVTTCGPDRVLAQCFPVPANGGRMKIRLGITWPLELDSLTQGQVAWPVFLERNFNLAPGLEHQIWLSSHAQLASRSAGLQVEPVTTGGYAIRGSLTEANLTAPGSGILVTRSEVREAWTTNDSSGLAVHQELRPQTAWTPSRLAIVVDGSQSMTDAYRALADALTNGPAEVKIILADDQPTELLGATNAALSALQTVAERLRQRHGVGGQDNVTALNMGLDWVAQGTNGAVLWLHGPQPVMLGPIDGLCQRLERRQAGPPIFDMATQVGPNVVLARFDGVGDWRIVTRQGTLADDLRRLFAHWGQSPSGFVYHRERIPLPADVKPTASRLVEQLWAYGEAKRLGWNQQMGKAISLAAQKQLVTPWTGAVVLETKAQYQETGLTPVDPATVFAVPEPSTWVLLVAGSVMLGWKLKRQRSARPPVQ